MTNPDFKEWDELNIFTLGEAGDLWGGANPKHAQPDPHVVVSTPPSRNEEPNFKNFARPKHKSDITLSAVLVTDKTRMFTKEPNTPNGRRMLKILEDAAENGELSVLDDPPFNKMTRVRRDALEAFVKRWTDERGWPLPWFLFSEERPESKPKSTLKGRNDALEKFEKLRREPKQKTTEQYIEEGGKEFRITPTQAREAFYKAAETVDNPDPSWARRGPKPKVKK